MLARAFCLVLLAACEIQPAPKKQAAPPPPPPAEQVAKPVEAVADAGIDDAGAGSAAPKIEISAACIEVGAKVAQVFIDGATDPGQKSIYEQERANMTRKTGEACTTQGWSEDARKCYLASKTPAEIKACELKFPAPRPPPPARAAPAGAENH